MARPETGWDLCEEVCRTIEERPLNYWQAAWSRPAKEVALMTKGSSSVEFREACGTSFCRAGTMCAILDGGPPDDDRWIENRATAIFLEAGISEFDISQLFAAGSTAFNLKYGSPEYVEKGIQGMRDFMVKHEKALKTLKITEDM